MVNLSIKKISLVKMYDLLATYIISAKQPEKSKLYNIIYNIIGIIGQYKSNRRNHNLSVIALFLINFS